MSAAIDHNFSLAPSPEILSTQPVHPGSSLDPFTVSDSPPTVRPGSSLDPFTVSDSPPAARQGSSLDPFTVSDSPPAARQGSGVNPLTVPDSPTERLVIFKGPASTIDPSTPLDLEIARSNNLNAIRRRIQYLESRKALATGQARTRTLGDRIDVLTARIRTAFPLNPEPEPMRRGTGSRAILALEAELIGSSRSAHSTRAPLAGPSRGGNAARAPVAPALLSRPNTRRSVAAGWRAPRYERLTYQKLWIGGRGPVEQEAHPNKEHHSCGICHFVKSHPVSYRCGHSHCYACIRLWLEHEWTCPECKETIRQEPFRHYGEESNIASEYPEWKDLSKVDYSFEGLRFPREGFADGL